VNDSASGAPIGSTVNTEYFLLAPDVLLGVPYTNSLDDAVSAQANTLFQMNYARSAGMPCGIVILADRLASQDAAARRIYAEQMDPAQILGTALIVNSPLSRAIGSFFLGLTRPRVKLKMVSSIDDALAWIGVLRAERNKASAS
jgi:hypothetical protein